RTRYGSCPAIGQYESKINAIGAMLNRRLTSKRKRGPIENWHVRFGVHPYFVSFRPWFPTELFLVVAQNQDMAIVSFTKRGVSWTIAGNHASIHIHTFRTYSTG